MPSAVQVGGPSGQMVGPDEFDRKICFDDLATGGSIMVFGPERDVLEVAHAFMEFFVEESCGYCTPCRVGNVLLKQRLEKIIAGRGEPRPRDLEELGETIKTTSRCGLGQTSPNPVLTTLKNFRPGLRGGSGQGLIGRHAAGVRSRTPRSAKPSASPVASRSIHATRRRDRLMSDTITSRSTARKSGPPGQTIIEAAEEAGVYIPRLCHKPGLEPHGSCRVCTVMVNGRPRRPARSRSQKGMIVENDTEKVHEHRRELVEMLFVEGNHFCMFCEKSGNCELQAMAYRLGITAPKYPYLFPEREVDATHPDVMIDRNRCILCGRCVRTSRDVDGKNVFEFVGRGREADRGQRGGAAGGHDLDVTDKAVEACPSARS
jgi:[NiFe] hydrogenase diaphorase moiety small subunit